MTKPQKKNKEEFGELKSCKICGHPTYFDTHVCCRLMKNPIKKNKEIIIKENDAHIIRHCLEYCLHRIIKHKKCGLLKVVGRKTVEKIKNKITLKNWGENKNKNPKLENKLKSIKSK